MPSDIGQDIKEVFEEVGTSYTFISEGVANNSGEFLVYELNRQVTKPFVREYFLEVELAYDTLINVGDLIIFADGRRFLTMNKTPEQFEDDSILFSGVLYRTNVDARILRSSGEDWDTHYRKRPSWITVEDSVDICMTESLYGHDLETDEELSQFGLENHEAYIPSWIGIEPLDRIEWASGEFYKVEVIKTRRFDGIDTVELTEDTRL
jgi:hypothetical protein